MRGTIENITFYVARNTTTAPDVQLTFWSSDDHNITVLGGNPGTAARLLGFEALTGASDFVREGSGATTSLWRAYVGGLSIFYKDDDQTGEFHVTVDNTQTTNLAVGHSRLEFGFRPEFGA